VFRDEDMQSLASLMSVNNNDIAPLDDFDDDEDVEGKCNCVMINWFLSSLSLSSVGSEIYCMDENGFWRLPSCGM
jgi:hypothetical protein